MHRIIVFLLLGLLPVFKIFAQAEENQPLTKTDTVISQPVIFNASSASEYIVNLLGMDSLWKSPGDTMNLSLVRLIEHYNEPFDSVKSRLSGFDYNSINPELSEIVKKDTLPLRWLNDTTFIIDTLALSRPPFITQKTIIIKVIDTSIQSFMDSIPAVENYLDSLLLVQDTISDTFIDSVYLKSLNIQLYQISNNKIKPSLIPPGKNKSFKFLPDSSKIIISEKFDIILADEKSPFYIVPGKGMPDSLRIAVDTLLAYAYQRDSVLIFINDIDGKRTPFWLTTGKDDLYRFWIKNSKNDSITVWIGNPEKNDLTLVLEEEIDLHRIEKKSADNIPITTLKPARTLIKVEPLKTIPVYWKYGLVSSFTLNQTHLSNWSKGGESSLAHSMDINTRADYTNTEAKTKWLNNVRLRYGAIFTDQNGLRKTIDILEFNSQYNKNLYNKVDFSTVFYMKHQIAKGYKYPNDSVVISKFLNPGTFTLGMGMEYQPDKNNRINLSILSYKNTFVLDTARINQKTHGIALDKRAKQEMGGQLLIKNILNLKEDLNISNTIRLFTNYFNKPENVDVDWEIDMSKRINWYFTVRLNLQLIYDDDVLFPVMDKNNKPVLLPDGSKKMEPKIQFKEMLGLALSFKI